MVINLVLKDNAKIPTASSANAAGFDLVATSRRFEFANPLSNNRVLRYVEYGTNVFAQIPKTHFGMLCARSSISNYDLMLCNGVGVIDSDYRGEIKLRFRVLQHLGETPSVYEVGDRVGQLLILPMSLVQFNVVSSLDQTERNEKGFGSTGI
jgi:dUTP pyrophosphatase